MAPFYAIIDPLKRWASVLDAAISSDLFFLIWPPRVPEKPFLGAISDAQSTQ